MLSVLLSLIYLAFVSLGLPDGLLGAAWPRINAEMVVPLSYAGIVSTIISLGTIVSSLLSDRLTRRFKAGPVTAVSVLLTAGALVGFALSPSFVWLCVFSVPYGLGAGAVDAALNNYVALHFASRHMSWLHCCWGVGAAIGPYIMGWALGTAGGWRGGYGTVAIIQFALTAVLFLTLPLWKRTEDTALETVEESPIGLRGALKIHGVPSILLAFFGYCAFEATAGLWASSYLVEYRGVAVNTAATFASLFYLGITVGRFVCGFVADRVGDKRMIRLGVAVMIGGTVLIALPLAADIPALCGLLMIGVGAAPVYPSIIHSTPAHFGKENTHAIVGIQMASAYCGCVLAPPLFGLIAQYWHIALYPYYMAAFILLLWGMTERVNRICK